MLEVAESRGLLRHFWGRSTRGAFLSSGVWPLSPEADALLAVVLKKVALRDGFSPAELGARVGLTKIQANAAARALANAGVLVIGFDNSAEFSDDYRRANTVVAPVSPKKKRRGAKPAAAGK